LRERLLAERMRFVACSAAVQAEADLASELRDVLADLEPQCLGLYWPQRGEFNAPVALGEHSGLGNSLRALPFARRAPPELHYRVWDGAAPTLVDECAIPTSASGTSCGCGASSASSSREVDHATPTAHTHGCDASQRSK